MEPESEKLFFFFFSPAQKIAYVSRYILSPEGEIFLLEQNDLQLADTYFEEWELSPEAQKKMLLEAHPDMVPAYHEKWGLGAKAQALYNATVA